MRKQERDHLLIAFIGPDMQRRDVSYPGMGVDICAFLKKKRHDIPSSLLDRNEERRDTVLPCVIYGCSMVQKESHHVLMAILCCKVEWCNPTLIGSLSGDTLFKEYLHAKDIPLRRSLA
jgi:hypothetical protein